MVGPGDEAAGRSHLRASHADRDQVIDLLKVAFAQGRLAKDEFDLRVGKVLASRTYGDLNILSAGIPAGLTGISAGLTEAQPAEQAPESEAEQEQALRWPPALRAGAVADLAAEAGAEFTTQERERIHSPGGARTRASRMTKRFIGYCAR